MIDRIFGKWTVLAYFPEKKPGKYYECLCSCGMIMIKAGTELRAGRSTRCKDCMYREMYDPDREIGKRYGKWKVLEFTGMHKGLQQFKVRCSCGFERIHSASDLRLKRSTQCMVCHNRAISLKNVKHGMHKSKLYKVWSAMLARCNNPNSTSYKWYGARGIKVCKSWEKFANFYKDMGDQPKGLTLDRINNNKGYCKSNCRWVTHQENCQNRRKKYERTRKNRTTVKSCGEKE